MDRTKSLTVALVSALVTFVVIWILLLPAKLIQSISPDPHTAMVVTTIVNSAVRLTSLFFMGYFVGNTVNRSRPSYAIVSGVIYGLLFVIISIVTLRYRCLVNNIPEHTFVSILNKKLVINTTVAVLGVGIAALGGALASRRKTPVSVEE